MPEQADPNLPQQRRKPLPVRYPPLIGPEVKLAEVHRPAQFADAIKKLHTALA